MTEAPGKRTLKGGDQVTYGAFEDVPPLADGGELRVHYVSVARGGLAFEGAAHRCCCSGAAALLCFSSKYHRDYLFAQYRPAHVPHGKLELFAIGATNMNRTRVVIPYPSLAERRMQIPASPCSKPATVPALERVFLAPSDRHPSHLKARDSAERLIVSPSPLGRGCRLCGILLPVVAADWKCPLPHVIVPPRSMLGQNAFVMHPSLLSTAWVLQVNHAAFAKVTSCLREIEVSNWGNIAVEEHYDLVSSIWEFISRFLA